MADVLPRIGSSMADTQADHSNAQGFRVMRSVGPY